jgi:hypothetical protein
MRSALVCLVLTLAPASAASAQQPDPLQQAGDAYAAFEIDLSAIAGARVSSPDGMDEVLLSAARRNPAALSRGWLAYAALTAAQSPAFVHGLQARVHAAGRAPVLRQLLRDGAYARRRPAGAQEAVQLVLSTMSADAARLSAAGDQYDRLSDQLQLNAPFAAPDDARRSARDQRLHSAEIAPLAPEMVQRLHVAPLAAAPITDPSAFGGAHFWDALTGLSPPMPAPTPMPARADRAAIIDRILTLAGLFIIAATPQSNARVDALLDDPISRECLNVQQLEFRQCVSVSHTPDEDAACLARHGLRGVGGCLSF